MKLKESIQQRRDVLARVEAVAAAHAEFFDTFNINLAYCDRIEFTKAVFPAAVREFGSENWSKEYDGAETMYCKNVGGVLIVIRHAEQPTRANKALEPSEVLAASEETAVNA